jgi:predicted DNA-binding transcriptional regulator AlpA
MELLTIEEVAELTRKTVSTIRWLRATGNGPKSGRLGKRVVYRRADVEEWIASAFDGGAA